MSNLCPLHNLFVRKTQKYYTSYVESTRLGRPQHEFNIQATECLRLHLYHLVDGLGCVQAMLICAIALCT